MEKGGGTRGKGKSQIQRDCGEVTGGGQDGREDGARLVFESSSVVKWKQRGESTVGSCGRGPGEFLGPIWGKGSKVSHFRSEWSTSAPCAISPGH